MGRAQAQCQRAGTLVLLLLVALGTRSTVGAGPAAAATGPPPAARPNILFVLADDLSNLEMAAMPNVRRLLADEGTSFSKAIVNVSLCCPSRTTILRGQYAHNTGVLTNGGANGGFEAAHRKGIEQSTIATWLQGAGYRTGLFGKYLNGYPNTVPNAYVPPGWSDWVSPVSGYPYSEFWYSTNENGSIVPYGVAAEQYGTDVFVRKTEEFVTQAGQAGVPFFAFLSVYAPHNPAVEAPRHKGLFADLRAPRTPAFGEKDVSDKPAWIRDHRPLSARGIEKTDAAFAQRARSLQAVDEGVASLVETLTRNGQLDNTYIVFASDNGYHFGQHGISIGKGSAYEEDIRVPLIVRGPHVVEGATRKRLVGNGDLAPTFADVAGVHPPSFVDGRSLVPLFGAGRPPSWRSSYLLDHWRETYTPGIPRDAARRGTLEPSESLRERQSGRGKSDRTPNWHGLRTRRYTYVEYGTGEKELYDLREDPAELKNIAESAPEHLLSTLHHRLAALRACRAERCRKLEDLPCPENLSRYDSRVKGLALRALKTSAEAADRVRGPRHGVIVLIYHCVGRGSGLELDLPVDRFEEQMAWLAAEERVAPIDQALDTLSAPVVPERDPIVVTFDDGPADFADVTVPILVRHRIPATIYLATAFLDEQRRFPYGAPPMSWAAVQDVMSTGLLTVGSHTHTHALLDRLPEDRVCDELDRSTVAIEQHLSVTPRHFAYPKSLSPSPTADAAVRARFRSAALAGTRPNRYGHTDPHRLSRSPIQASDEMRWFRAKVSGGMGFEDDVRRVLNRWRYADAES